MKAGFLQDDKFPTCADKQSYVNDRTSAMAGQSTSQAKSAHFLRYLNFRGLDRNGRQQSFTASVSDCDESTKADISRNAEARRDDHN